MPRFDIRAKWRPPLALVIYSVLITVMTVPVLLLIWFRPATLDLRPVAPAEIGALVSVVLLTLVVGFVLVRAIKAPLDALVRRTQEIASDGRDAIMPLDSYGTREVAALAQSFFDLAGDLVERTDYVRTFAAHVSHELKSPLTAIAGAAELLREAETDEAPMTPAQRRLFLDNIMADARRLDRLLVRLRDLAHAETPIAAGSTTLSQIVAVLEARFPELVVRSVGETDQLIALPLEAATIAFVNLAENALQHGATQLDVTVLETPDHLSILVTDNGTGIPPEIEQAIFRPFFTTRADDGGTGMGLRIVEALLAAHRSDIRLTKAGTRGAAFEIRIRRVA